jgi:hypothetical protein
MTWKKHLRIVTIKNSGGMGNNPNSQNSNSNSTGMSGTTANYSSYLPEVYAGHPNRIQRYSQYDDMDRDSDISAALNIIADFCTQNEEQNNQPFQIKYKDSANETEIKLIKGSMEKWTKLNDFKSRLWYIFRGVIKNGDQFFVRDPETKEWLWVDHFNVELVRVDETQGKEPTEYIIRNLDYNKQQKLATKPFSNDASAGQALSRGAVSTSQTNMTAFQLAGGNKDMHGNPSGVNQSHAVDAKSVVHLSLSAGMDIHWPFGSSILESVFKSFKQKELLEDAVIIYRVQRSPERRIFNIDVGGMNPVMANAYVERVKNEIHQRRIPNRNGGGSSVMDAAYNPLSMMEDYFFAQSADGRGSSVTTLAGGEQTGEIGDLEYFNKRMRAGLGVPNSYMPGAEEQSSYNDGKLGAAMIQEYRFNKYCMRLQNLLAPVFDREFKLFLKESGLSIEDDLFELEFNAPQNFHKYRQIELDSQQMNVYAQIADNKRLSERFKLQRYLNLTQEEILENQRLWAEENPGKVKAATGGTEMNGGMGGGGGSDGLGAVGVGAPPEDMDFDSGDSESIGDEGGEETGDDADTDAPADDEGFDTL